MTSTRRVSGSGGRMWTSTQKIKIRVHGHHTVFSSCKEFGIIFTRISSLDRKKVEIFLQYNLFLSQFNTVSHVDACGQGGRGVKNLIFLWTS